MAALLALLCFVAAVVVFVVRLLDGNIDVDWGFVFISAGLALSMLGGAWAAGKSLGS